MPNYDYKCKKCKKVFSVHHKMSESPEIKCPKCEGETERLITGGENIIFKGSGFYVNDYKKKEPCSDCGDKKEKKGGHTCSGDCSCGH